jgi:hypothetical protein
MWNYWNKSGKDPALIVACGRHEKASENTVCFNKQECLKKYKNSESQKRQ